jgi:hypothetical protein
MNHDEFERLADAVIDGGGTPTERERLTATVSAEPELRERWADLQATRGAFAHAGLATPPADLHDAVLRAVAHETHERSRKESRLETLVASLRARPGLAIGGAIAAALAIGVIGFGALTRGFITGRTVGPGTSATMSPLSSTASATTLELDGTQLEVTGSGGAHERHVHLSAHGAGTVTATLEWDPAGLRLNDTTLNPDGLADRATLRIEGSVVRDLSFVSLRAGDASIRVRLRGAHDEKHATLALPR